jgi:23S rRNA (cytosine1962-C5)-methyltransferase
MPEATAIVTSRGAARIAAGHPWIYRSDVLRAEAAPGTIVRVVNEQGRFFGRAFYSSSSQITLRLLTTTDVPIDAAFWRQRLQGASDFRAGMLAGRESYRLVHGEGDFLPSVVVDRYGPYFVIQTLSQGAEQVKATLIELLVELFAPLGILERNDPRVRQREGLPQTVSVLHGEVPQRVLARINGLDFELDLFAGQKTGAFLDQQENYAAAARYARGKALDCFTYQGGFALSMAPRCSFVEAIDLSPEAIAGATANAARNAIGNVACTTANAFDFLKACDDAGRRFDTVILDPPAFAKDRASIPAALRGYKEINLRSMRLLQPGGVLVTCSCSHHISEPLFLTMLSEAAQDTGRLLRVVERRTQACDHPILLSIPETIYIKAFILNVL